MVVLNCGAIPGSLLESELFGHEEGAFTGAIKSRKGRLEIANGGTIFLDEIDQMGPHLQVELLRVLENGRFERVGGTETIHVDVRIIAATSKDLTVAINSNTFREDLYYRLNVIAINVPPLKQRPEDIPLLVSHFLTESQKGKGEKVTGLSAEAMSFLLEYGWPGASTYVTNAFSSATKPSQKRKRLTIELTQIDEK